MGLVVVWVFVGFFVVAGAVMWWLFNFMGIFSPQR
jgi:hypothetical protein